MVPEVRDKIKHIQNIFLSMKKTEFQKIISRQIKFESRWHICFDVFNIFVECNPNLFWNYELKNQVVDVQAIPDEGEDGLRAVKGEGSHSGAIATDKDDSLHGYKILFLSYELSPSNCQHKSEVIIKTIISGPGTCSSKNWFGKTLF